MIMRKEAFFFILSIAIVMSGCATESDESNIIQDDVEQFDAQDKATGEVKEQNIPAEPETADPLDDSNADEEEDSQETSEQWESGKLVIPGNFADADIVKLSDGTYRIYYGIEPEVPGNNLEVYSATSSDGKMWKQDTGTRKTQSVFPDIVRTHDGKWRMYFQQQSLIKSAKSNDGLKWTDEPGIRIDSANPFGLQFEAVVAPTTLLLDDNTYLMVYSGRINKKYDVNGAKVPNNDMRVLVWATSIDGLSWNKKGIALDARNPVLEGFADGPDLVHWDDGTIRLYFWGYKGIYYSTFENGKFAEPVIIIKPPNPQNYLYPSNPPGDPTLIKIGMSWHLYYGIWKNGIFYTTLDQIK